MMVTGKKGSLCGCWLNVYVWNYLRLGCGNRELGTKQTREFVIICMSATCTVSEDRERERERARVSELLCSRGVRK